MSTAVLLFLGIPLLPALITILVGLESMQLFRGPSYRYGGDADDDCCSRSWGNCYHDDDVYGW